MNSSVRVAPNQIPMFKAKQRHNKLNEYNNNKIVVLGAVYLTYALSTFLLVNMLCAYRVAVAWLCDFF